MTLAMTTRLREKENENNLYSLFYTSVFPKRHHFIFQVTEGPKAPCLSHSILIFQYLSLISAAKHASMKKYLSNFESVITSYNWNTTLKDCHTTKVLLFKMDITLISLVVRRTILTMSLLPFWALNISVALLSIQGQKALECHQKYLYLCSEDERRSYGLRTT